MFFWGGADRIGQEFGEDGQRQYFKQRLHEQFTSRNSEEDKETENALLPTLTEQ